MISHAIDDGLLVIRAEGTYTSDDIRATFKAALSDPNLPPNARLLVDARESQSNPSRHDIEVRLTILKTLLPAVAPLCAVVVSTPLLYGVARMYQAGSEVQHGPRIEVFKNIDAAKVWLLSQVAVYVVSILGDVGPWLTAVA